MFIRLFLLFTVVPIIELAILIKIGTAIGALNTIGIVLITGAVGAYLARSQGFGVLTQIRLRMDQGFFPNSELLDGVLVPNCRDCADHTWYTDRHRWISPADSSDWKIAGEYPAVWIKRRM